MWTEEYSAAVKSRYVHQNWPINHLGGAAEPSSMYGHHGLSTRMTPSAETKDHHLKTDCTVSGNTLLGKKGVCLNLRTHDLPVRLVFRKSGYNSILYFTHVLPTNAGIVQATNASSQIFCHPQHNYRLCLPPRETAGK